MLSFKLPDTGRRHIKKIRQSADRLKATATNVGTRSSKLVAATAKLKQFLSASGHESVATQITTPLEAKAFAKVFAHDEAAKKLEISDETLAAIEGVSSTLKRQTLMFLIEGYLFRYDEGIDADSLSKLANFIQKNLGHYQLDGRQSGLRALAQNRSTIFNSAGPSMIVEKAYDQQVDLVNIFTDYGLDAYRDGQYFLQCRYLYYLKEIESIPVGEGSQVLSKICEKQVYQSSGKNMPQLGHDIVGILIDRSAGGVLSEEWQRVILEIAGDPRVPKSSVNYTTWWSHLGQDRVNLMRGWLSRLDLKLFLRVIQEYGKSAGDADLTRMYPARKKFLEGLIDQGLVFNSRLFVNRRAEQFLVKGFDETDLPEYARVSDPNRSMIYLQVGKLHMIEGSHNFKLWLFPHLPEKNNILDYQVADFSARDLSSSLEKQYLNEFDYEEGFPESIVHRGQNYNWQNKAIDFLREYGVDLDIEKLFTRRDYSRYIKIHGL